MPNPKYISVTPEGHSVVTGCPSGVTLYVPIDRDMNDFFTRQAF